MGCCLSTSIEDYTSVCRKCTDTVITRIETLDHDNCTVSYTATDISDRMYEATEKHMAKLVKIKRDSAKDTLRQRCCVLSCTIRVVIECSLRIACLTLYATQYQHDILSVYTAITPELLGINTKLIPHVAKHHTDITMRYGFMVSAVNNILNTQEDNTQSNDESTDESNNSTLNEIYI